MKSKACCQWEGFDKEKKRNDRPAENRTSQDGRFYNGYVVRRFGDVGEVNAYLGMGYG